MNSVAVSVMNRNGRVTRCLESWLKWKGCGELIVLDWSSEVPVKEFLSKKKFNNAKIKIVRVDGEEYFSRSKAFNLSVKHCSYETIVKIDIDYILTNIKLLEGHLRKVSKSKSFIHCSRSGNLTGFCAFSKADFDKTGGYNELLEDWGYEDEDLYSRLAKEGLASFQINNPKRFLFHIPHSFDLSVKNHKNKNRKKSLLKNAEMCEGKDSVPDWVNRFNKRK